jgi:MarR family transcriptional regulator, negative regulator of the multidrug operon emrRAB
MRYAYDGAMTGYLENLLGAVSLAVTDAVAGEAAEGVGLGGEAAGALVLIALRPGMSVKRLAERLRLSHPGTVRLSERLAGAGWVERTQGEDRRVVRLSLTKKGVAAVKQLRAARAKRLDSVTRDLSAAERRALAPILEKIVMRLTHDRITPYANCRLCDAPACEAHGCPVEKKARAMIAEES